MDWPLVDAAYADEDTGDSLKWWARDRIKKLVPLISLQDLAWQVHNWFLTDRAFELGYSNEDAHNFIQWWGDTIES